MTKYSDIIFGKEDIAFLEKLKTLYKNRKNFPEQIPFRIFIVADSMERSASAAEMLKKEISVPGNPISVIRFDGFSKEESDNTVPDVLLSAKEAILYTDSAGENLLKETNGDLYYNIFPYNCHWKINPVDNSAIYEKTVSLLQNSGFTFSEDFLPALEQYILTVYPKALLRDTAFVEDLFYKLITASSMRDEHIFIPSDIPRYVKPQNTADVLSQIYRSSPYETAAKQLCAITNSIQYFQTHPSRKSVLSLHKVFAGTDETAKQAFAIQYAELLFSLGIKNSKNTLFFDAAAMDSQKLKQQIGTAEEHVLYFSNAEKLDHNDIQLLLSMPQHIFVFSVSDTEAIPLPPEFLIGTPISFSTDKEALFRYILILFEKEGILCPESLYEAIKENLTEDRVSVERYFQNAVLRYSERYTETTENAFLPSDFGISDEVQKKQLPEKRKESSDATDSAVYDRYLNDISESVQGISKENKTFYDVLFLSLSLFPKEIRMSKYTYGTETCTGLLQQDHVPILITKKYQTILDKIIVLNTAETASKDEKDTKNRIALGSFGLSSVYDHFIRVAERLGVTDNAVSDAVIKESESDAVVDALKKLTNITQNNKKIRIFLGTNGGFRNTQQLVNAIVSLFDNYDTVAEIHILKCDGPTNNEFTVREVDSTIFDFTSGINEFTHYAKADALKKYYAGKEQPELLKKICNVADAIQTCAIGSFNQALAELRDEMKKNTPKETDPLSLFFEVIKKNYGVLLRDSCTDIDKIRWCTKKGLIQQAVTLVEALFPKYSVSHEWFSYESWQPHTKDNYTKEEYLYQQIAYHFRQNRGIDGFPHLKKPTSAVLPFSEFRFQEKDDTQHQYRMKKNKLTDAAHAERLLYMYTEFKVLRNFLNHAEEKSMQVSVKDIENALLWFCYYCDENEKPDMGITEVAQTETPDLTERPILYRYEWEHSSGQYKRFFEGKSPFANLINYYNEYEQTPERPCPCYKNSKRIPYKYCHGRNRLHTDKESE